MRAHLRRGLSAVELEVGLEGDAAAGGDLPAVEGRGDLELALADLLDLAVVRLQVDHVLGHLDDGLQKK